MKRSLKVERLYTLGDYKNIKFIDEIVDIPDELSMNMEVTQLLYFLQFLQIEQANIEYRQLATELAKFKDIDEIITHIEELKEQTLQDITKLIKNGDIKND